jgi:hypothetical protein
MLSPLLIEVAALNVTVPVPAPVPFAAASEDKNTGTGGTEELTWMSLVDGIEGVISSALAFPALSVATA